MQPHKMVSLAKLPFIISVAKNDCVFFISKFCSAGAAGRIKTNERIRFQSRRKKNIRIIAVASRRRISFEAQMVMMAGKCGQPIFYPIRQNTTHR